MPLIYSILCNNRSFSLISRYKTTYKSYLRMVTDQPEAWTNAKTSHFPWSRCSPGILVECSLLARGASRWAAPAVLALGGLQLRKWGKGNNFGSCAIKFDLDSEEVFRAAAWKKQTHLWRSQEGPGRLGRLWFSGLLWLCQRYWHTPPLHAFSVLPTCLFSPVHPS